MNASNSFKRHYFADEIILLCVRCDLRFDLFSTKQKIKVKMNLVNLYLLIRSKSRNFANHYRSLYFR